MHLAKREMQRRLWEAVMKPGWLKTVDWERLAAIIEIALLPLVVGTAVIGVFEYRDNHKRDRREEAARAYDRADQNYNDFLKVCLEHPDVDCYSGNLPVPGPGADGADAFKVKQRVVMSMLVDVFEVAFVNYNNNNYVDDSRDAYCTQWPDWIAAVRKYARRDAFRETWSDIADEFDLDFQDCVRDLIAEQQGRQPPSPDDSAVPSTCFKGPGCPTRPKRDEVAPVPWTVRDCESGGDFLGSLVLDGRRVAKS